MGRFCGEARKGVSTGALVLGLAGLAGSAMVFCGPAALAANGSQPGNLILSPLSGPLTAQPTWSTSTACPTGYQGSAVAVEFNTDGSFASRISLVVPSPAAPLSNETLLANIGNLLSKTNITPGGTVEWAVACYNGLGATGSLEYVQSTLITEDSSGTTYVAEGGSCVFAATTTTLTASPNPPAGAGSTVILKAVVTSGTAFPAGTVQFQVDGTNINAVVAINTGGVEVDAVTVIILNFPGTGSRNLAAVFTPTTSGCGGYASSSGTYSLLAGWALAGGTNPVPVTVTVPATGSLIVTVATGAVTLTASSPATTPDQTATGTLNTVTIADTRNTSPGWSVSGQASTFQGPGSATIPANSLGWTPALTAPPVDGASAGPPVSPIGANPGSVGPGLGAAATLASATPGNGLGTNTFTAALLLDIPSTTPPGAYADTLTVTYVTVGP